MTRDVQGEWRRYRDRTVDQRFDAGRALSSHELRDMLDEVREEILREVFAHLDYEDSEIAASMRKTFGQ